MFPELHEYLEDEEALIAISDYSTISEINDNRDRVRDWISENDYRTMSVDERNQLALDRYKNRTKSNWEIGIEYELYVGYLLIEGKHPFNGKYHVLDGLISNGNYNNINIEKLLKRLDDGNIKEIILALEPNIDGEVTSLYISKLLESKNVKISKLAHGVPLGADMDYLDLLTLETALNDRKQINSK